VYVDLRPWQTRFVWLLVRDHWVLAQLEAYRLVGDSWQGRVRWSVDGLSYLDWVPAERIRRGVWVEA
jgi:hypothetical protein